MSGRSRRSVLAGLGATALGALAGCLGGSPSARNGFAERLRGGARERASDLLDDRPVRCRGESVTAARREVDEPGYDDGFEFFPRYGTVRYVAFTAGGDPAASDAMAFSRWASIRCAEVALERVRSVTADRLKTDEFGSGTVTSPRPFFDERVVELARKTLRDGEGNVVDESVVPFEALVENAPRTVETTYALNGKTYGRPVPVYATEATYRRR